MKTVVSETTHYCKPCTLATRPNNTRCRGALCHVMQPYKAIQATGIAKDAPLTPVMLNNTPTVVSGGTRAHTTGG